MDQNMVRLPLCALLRLELQATIAEITRAAETVNCRVCRLDRLASAGGATLRCVSSPSICEPEPRFHSPWWTSRPAAIVAHDKAGPLRFGQRGGVLRSMQGPGRTCCGRSRGRRAAYPVAVNPVSLRASSSRPFRAASSFPSRSSRCLYASFRSRITSTTIIRSWKM
jgi:hypothetical protein